jgi:hypothetical protein
MVMPPGQIHKSHFATDFTRKRKFLMRQASLALLMA